ncbi:hypothetical protein K32_11360 [Kaistia sp. 32K]|nr:hypothetical protein K32_11360 [Kaistia sp. 32K]
MTVTDYAKATKELADANPRKLDPYRPFLQFLVGHLTFTGVILVGALATLPKKGAELEPPMAAALGGVLAWMALSALAASLLALVAQVLRFVYVRSKWDPAWDWSRAVGIACVLLPIGLGMVAVAYCLRAGVALLGGAATLPSLLDTVKGLFV